MINIIKSEYYKFKGTKTFLMLIACALIAPVILTISHFFSTPTPTEFASSMTFLVSIMLSAMLLIFSAIMINLLFGVDIKNNTLKSIIPLPISTKEYINRKLINLFIWMVIFSLISWIAAILLFNIVGMGGFDLNVCLTGLGHLILGTIIIFLIMTPIVFIYLLSKSSSITIILIIALILLPLITLIGGDAFSFIQPVTDYLPWSNIEAIVRNNLTIEPIYEYILIIATFIVGYVLSYLYMDSKDIE